MRLAELRGVSTESALRDMVTEALGKNGQSMGNGPALIANLRWMRTNPSEIDPFVAMANLVKSDGPPPASVLVQRVLEGTAGGSPQIVAIGFETIYRNKVLMDALKVRAGVEGTAKSVLKGMRKWRKYHSSSGRLLAEAMLDENGRTMMHSALQSQWFASWRWRSRQKKVANFLKADKNRDILNRAMLDRANVEAAVGPKWFRSVETAFERDSATMNKLAEIREHAIHLMSHPELTEDQIRIELERVLKRQDLDRVLDARTGSTTAVQDFSEDAPVDGLIHTGISRTNNAQMLPALAEDANAVRMVK